MATPKETVKYGLFQYPTLYKNPIDMLVAVFLSVGSYRWKNGEVDHTEWDKDYNGKMRYDAQYKHDNKYDGLRDLYLGYELQEAVELSRMQFVEANIDKIVTAPLTNTYFGRELEGDYIVRYCWHLTYKGSKPLYIPKNITKEWAMVLCEFIQYIIPRMNGTYQIGDQRSYAESIKHWPIEAKRLLKKFKDAEELVYPIAYGKTKKQHDAEITKMFAEMDAETESK